MFPQFQNLFPFFLPSLYHFSSASSSKIFIDETEKSWKVYPSCSFTSFVPSKHIRRISGKKEGVVLSLPFRKLLMLPQKPTLPNYPPPPSASPHCSPTMLIILNFWKDLLHCEKDLWQSMWTTPLQDRKSKISEKGKIFEITGRSRTQDKNQWQ